MSNKILSTLNIGNNSYEIDDAFARQKIKEVDNNLLKINPVYSTSGSVVSFDDGADNLPLDELIVDINPVQDLHGYDHPWIGGCGNNLWGGKKMAEDIHSAIPNASEFDEENKTISIIANSGITRTILYSGPFKENTQYSFIVSGDMIGRCNMKFMYSDDTTSETFIGGANISDAGKTINAVIGWYYTGTTVLNYEESGLFEGVISADQFVPYENICPISGWTRMNVQRCGKNLIDPSKRTKKSNTIYHWYAVDGFVLKQGTTYTLSSDTKATAVYIYTIDGTLLGGGHATETYTPSEDTIVYFQIYNASEADTVNIMLELGSAATNFEPYNGTEIPISWESEAGTVYGGNLNVLTGVLTIDRKIVDINNLTKNGYAGYGGFYYQDNTFSVNANNRVCVSCNLLPVKNSHNSKTLGVYCAENIVYFEGVNVTGFANTLAECTEWLKQSNIELILPLTEPITYQLTPHEIKTFLDQNNIFTNINSKNILVSYKADVQKCIDNKLNVAETAYRTTSIPYGQVDATSTSTNFTATIDGITELRDGVCVILKNGVVTSASGFTININNLGAKPVYSSMAASTRETTVFNSAYTIMLIYSTSLNNGDGGWWFYRGYDSDTNTTGYVLRTNSMALPLSSHTHRYRLLFTSADGTHFVPANNDTTDNATVIKNVCQEKIDPFGTIRYYNGSATLEAEGVPSGSTIWEQNTITLGYSFNRVGGAINLAIRKPVYIKALPQSDGSAIIDANVPYVQDLPTTEDGYIYIYLGVTYSASNMELTSYHPVYYYYNGAIRPWLGFTDSEHAQDIVSSVNGKTGTVTLTAEDVGAMQGMTILSYGHSTWAEFLEAYEANRVVYCKASANSDPSTGQQGRMAFFAYVQYKRQGYSDRAEFQYYRSTPTHTNTQQGDQVFCYSLTPAGGGTWSVEVRQASSRVVAGTGLSSAYTTDKVTLSLDADYKNKIDTLWTDYQSALIALDGGE